MLIDYKNKIRLKRVLLVKFRWLSSFFLIFKIVT